MCMYILYIFVLCVCILKGAFYEEAEGATLKNV